MKRISIDMDGVLADVYRQFLIRHEEDFGHVLTEEEMRGRPEHIAFPNAYKYANSQGFFRNVPVMEGSLEAMQKLNEHYNIFIVSAAMEFPTSVVDKQLWLNEHFPFIGWQQMVFCGSKEIIKADIMIDDHFKNLNKFSGETILFTQPHNKLADALHHKRVESWQEIERLLIP